MNHQELKRFLEMTKMQHHPAAIEVAGEAGEDQVFNEAKSVWNRHHRALSLFPSLRVPRENEKGKFEIDLVMVGHFGILALEVKNWGGSLSMNRSGEWWQTTSGGHQIQHKNAHLLLERKANALHAHLAKNGIAIAREHIIPALVWTKDIDVASNLAQRIRALNVRDLATFIETVLVKPPESRPRTFESMTEVNQTLLRLPTWDTIYLRGGRVVRGDIFPEEAYVGQTSITRKNAEDFRFYYPNQLWLWYLVPPLMRWKEREGRHHWAKVDPGQEVSIKISGQNQEATFCLAEIHRIIFGWRDGSYYHTTGSYPLEIKD